MKKRLETLTKVEGPNTLSLETLNSTQAERLNLNKHILERLDEIVEPYSIYFLIKKMLKKSFRFFK